MEKEIEMFLNTVDLLTRSSEEKTNEYLQKSISATNDLKIYEQHGGKVENECAVISISTQDGLKLLATANDATHLFKADLTNINQVKVTVLVPVTFTFSPNSI